MLKGEIIPARKRDHVIGAVLERIRHVSVAIVGSEEHNGPAGPLARDTGDVVRHDWGVFGASHENHIPAAVGAKDQIFS